MGDIGKMFDPKTVALIGASEGPDTAGRTVLENLLRSGRQEVFPVNPAHETVLDLTCYPRIGEIKSHIDLAVIATRAGAVAEVLEECGKAGVEGVIIMSSGFRNAGPEGEKLENELEQVRRKYGIPLLGPDSLGLIRPDIGLNASLLNVKPRPGNIAFISQGNRISDTIVDWNVRSLIGFSIFASLGSMIDVGFGDLIDIAGDDDETRSIMLYMENVGDARRFLSAARGFARSKPIVVMKSGLFARSRTRDDSNGLPALSRCDQVYDAAFKRAGVVRVKEVADLFNVSQVLNFKILPEGPKLTIITNAGDAGIIATDTLLLLHGELAQLSKETIGKLDAFFPPYWSKGNPVYISEDADIARFVKTIEICVKDPATDGILVICATRVIGEQTELAKAIAGLSKHTRKPILCTILGKHITDAVDLDIQNPIPTYGTPEEAVRTYLYMHKYKRNLELLYETPLELSVMGLSPKLHVKKLIMNALGKGVTALISNESSSLLAVYGVPTLKQVLTRNLEEARRVADDIGYPVFLKAEASEGLPVGKALVAWAKSPEDLEKAYDRLESLADEQKPGAAIAGITIRKMLEEIDYQIRVGSKKDKEFGAVLLLGKGGLDAGILRNFAVGFPPLNHVLARRLIEEAKIFRGYLHPSGEIPPSCFSELEEIIVSLSNLIVDFPDISEIDINPIAIADGKAYALDARIVLGDDIEDHHSSQYPHLVISPYPARYTVTHNLADGTEVFLRPIRPEDERLYLEMLNSLTRETMRKRFFGLLKDITHDMMARFCNVDYDREIAIVAEVGNGDERRIIGVETLIVENSSKSGQFAILVHDDYHGKGVGFILMDTIIRVCGDKELEQLYGSVLSENEGMLKFCKKMGFTEKFPNFGTSLVTMDLRRSHV